MPSAAMRSIVWPVVSVFLVMIAVPFASGGHPSAPQVTRAPLPPVEMTAQQDHGVHARELLGHPLVPRLPLGGEIDAKVTLPGR